MRYVLALLVLLALQFVPGVGIGQAQAQTEAQAIAQCFGHIHQFSDWSDDVCIGPNGVDDGTPQTGFYRSARNCAKVKSDGLGDTLQPASYSPGTCNAGGSNFAFTSRCENGVDYANKTCNPSQAECLAKPYKLAGTVNANFGATCSESCAFQLQGGKRQTITTGGGASLDIVTGGVWAPTGSACDMGAPDVPEPQPQGCVTDVASGQSVCVKSDAKNCFKLSDMEEQICWEPGETGEKTVDEWLQVRNAGNLPTTPTTTPPPGDTFQQAGGSTTTTNTVTNTETNTTTTITTTTTHYKTESGANAGGSGAGDSGEAADGTGDATDGMPHVPDAPPMPFESVGLPSMNNWSSGLPSTSSCPAPIAVTVELLGVSEVIEFDFGPLCQLAELVRPLVIALGLLLSGFIVAGVRSA